MSEILKDIKSWLETGNEKSKDIVDLPWDVRVLKDGSLIAANPRMPIKLHVYSLPSNRAVRIIANTGLETVYMDNIMRLRIYRLSMMLNNDLELMKYVLLPLNDELALAADVSTYKLTEHEFNEILSALFTGLTIAMEVFKIKEEITKKMIKTLMEMIQERVRKGYSRDQLIDFLMKRVGMKRQNAEDLLNRLLGRERAPYTL